MTAKTRFRLLLWPVLIALVALGWWGLVHGTGIPWWSPPLILLAFIGVIALVGLWVGAVDNAHKAAKDEAAESERKRAQAELDAVLDPGWNDAARQLLTEQERRDGWTDPETGRGNA